MENTKNQRTIVLERKQDRAKTLRAIAASGGKVLHDSGARILIVEIPADINIKETLEKGSSVKKTIIKGVEINGILIQKSEIKNLDNIFKKQKKRLTEQEHLFVNAMELRFSPEYIKERALRKPGSTPEEQLNFEGSEYLGDDY